MRHWDVDPDSEICLASAPFTQGGGSSKLFKEPLDIILVKTWKQKKSVPTKKYGDCFFNGQYSSQGSKGHFKSKWYCQADCL